MSVWTYEHKMTETQSRELINSFLENCVNADFQRSFVKHFGKHKPILGRYFKQGRSIEQMDRLSDVLGIQISDNVLVSVLYGSLSASDGLILEGTPVYIEDILGRDVATLAMVLYKAQKHFFFRDAQTHFVFYLGKRIENIAHNRNL